MEKNFACFFDRIYSKFYLQVKNKFIDIYLNKWKINIYYNENENDKWKKKKMKNENENNKWK
jgi:hypothetical protein